MNGKYEVTWSWKERKTDLTIMTWTIKYPSPTIRWTIKISAGMISELLERYDNLIKKQLSKRIVEKKRYYIPNHLVINPNTVFPLISVGL